MAGMQERSTRNDLCNGCGIKKYELYDKLEWFKLIKTLKNEDSYAGNVTSHLMILHQCLSLSFSDSFCYLCKNEFFNKYFLRVHNRKKHGICSHELLPEKVQKILNQMAKEANKTGIVPPTVVNACTVSTLEALTTQFLLKVHMQILCDE